MSETPEYPNHVVAVYPTHSQVETAIRELNHGGVDMKRLSVIGQNYHSEEQPLGFINAGDRMLSWGKFGAFWGAVWGALWGAAMLFLPGIGYVYFAGWIVYTLGGAVLGGAAGALGGALASIGVPKDSVVRYETALKAGRFLLIVHGNSADIEEAKNLLKSSKPEGVESYTSQPSLVTQH